MFIFFSICSCYETKYQYECTWLKIFYHKSTGGVFFKNFSQSMFSLDPNLYSIFSFLDDRFKINGKFEFLLEYPELSGYNRWRQALLPWNNDEITGNAAEGYENVYNTWSGSYWGGLVKSNHGCGVHTLIDGSAGTIYWHYAIGCTSTYYSPQYPGPDGYLVVECCLWIRLSDTSLLNKETIIITQRHIPLVHLLYLLIVQ